MGCDGGTIPKRDELVRVKKKPEQKDKQSELSFRWGHCAITQNPLQKPIVACQLGRLYSKLAVIESLLDKSKLPPSACHIKSLKDVKELQLTDNPAYTAKAKTSETYDDSLIAPYICPVIGLEMTGKFRFVYLWSCGCVVSERAMKAVSASLCHKCQKPFKNEDVIVLNGNDEDIEAMKINMETRKSRGKATKKNKEVTTTDQSVSRQSSTLASSTAVKPGPSTSSADIKPSSSTKRQAVDMIDPVFKKTRNEYSVAKDPKATEVFKSLFTTHESAAKQTKAHWVTYNPFYN